MSFDIRDRRCWYDAFNEQRMILGFDLEAEDGTEERIELPAVFVVCDVCNGKGTHVNPNVDRHGLSREDFDEDPDFRDAYFAGRYDVPCHQCGGRRVAPEIDEAHADKAQLARVHEKLNDAAAYAAECAAERRMGA